MPGQRSPAEPYLRLVPSIVWKGHRFRAIFNRLHYRRPEETFHEFLIAVVQWTLGERWWKQQIGMPASDWHVIVSWKFAFSELTKRFIDPAHRESDNRYVTDASGPVWALLSLGYDLFCLQAANALPKFLIDRLRKNREFQAARYEIAVAAIMMRSGFDVEFLDRKEMQAKHCEFIARHRESGVQIGVEAKSRVREGVLHEKGTFTYDTDSQGIAKLLRKAQKQKPEGVPFLIFVDVNLPPPPSQSSVEAQPWFQEAKRAVGSLGTPTADRPDPFNALVVTNFAYHFGSSMEKAPRGESAFVVSLHPETPIADPAVLGIVHEVLRRYGRIPDEV